jgi:hypothetical protein
VSLLQAVGYALLFIFHFPLYISQMPTRTQQIGLLVLAAALALYTLARVLWW